MHALRSRVTHSVRILGISFLFFELVSDARWLCLDLITFGASWLYVRHMWQLMGDPAPQALCWPGRSKRSKPLRIKTW